MKIVISEHAKRRAEERGIDEETIRSVLEEPLDVIKVKFGRKAAYRQFGEKYVVVIFEEQKDEIVVVTTLKVDKERLKRYGFGGV
ncbi:DUF4258 domain-containing protein [Archaeoglobus sp.]|jgi:hypothetical protein|uniref:DUF4258 domain-containing protein n=1 Tax=Archaeoglobus sp. TaxID=1872626 RepID=UPI0024AC2DB4|nr:DUF4258 domain-containing protein [Archaeoglobus sp.]MDI3497895.1 hypothetical protein [Archaeoglobus sp.]